MRYLSSPSGSLIKIGTISPASLPSFLLVETDGMGNICVSAHARRWTELDQAGARHQHTENKHVFTLHGAYETTRTRWVYGDLSLSDFLRS